MLTFEREGDALTLEGNEADLKQLIKQVEKAAHPEQKTQVALRVLDRNGGHLNLILRKGRTRDSL